MTQLCALVMFFSLLMQGLTSCQTLCQQANNCVGENFPDASGVNRPYRPIHTKRQRQRNGNIPWDKIAGFDFYQCQHCHQDYVASIEHGEKYRCVHTQHWR